MPEAQELSMEAYVASRTSAPVETKPAATAPKEQVETAPESATGTPESEKAKGGGWQRRIDKLTKRSTELEETLREEREARQRLEAKLAGRDPAELTKKETSTEPGARPKPKQTDAKYKSMGDDAFDTYIEDLADWTAEQRISKVKSELTTEQKQAQEKAQAEQTNKVIEDNWKAKAEKAKAKTADWAEVVFDEDSEAHKLVQGSVIDGFILDPENNGPEVLYHLCKNPGEIERISKLSPQKQIRELGRIEESLDTAKEENASPEPKKASLPAPIKPVTTSTAKSAAKPDNMSMEDYAKWRTANRR